MILKHFLILILIFLLLPCCGRKLDPTLEDYLPPRTIEKISLKQYDNKIIVCWNYPEKDRMKISSFYVEKGNKDKTEVIGYYDSTANCFEDINFFYGERYLYRIYAINKKGIHSSPKEISIIPQKIQEVRDIRYEVKPEGIKLLWKSENYTGFNVYRVYDETKRSKIAVTDQPEVLINLNRNDFEENKKELILAVTTFLEKEHYQMESKATVINIPFDLFIPSIPKKVQYGIKEEGIFLSWQEAPESWIKGYRVYKKILDKYELIGETMIPLFLDKDYTDSNTKLPIYYKISSVGPILESEKIEIKVEMSDG